MALELFVWPERIEWQFEPTAVIFVKQPEKSQVSECVCVFVCKDLAKLVQSGHVEWWFSMQV